MTAHGPEAIRLVREALEDAGVGPDVGDAFLVDVTGRALDVLESPGTTREDAIEALLADHDLARPFVTKALDLAVEALTANTQE